MILKKLFKSKLFYIPFSFFLFIYFLYLSVVFLMGTPFPHGEQGHKADTMALKMTSAINTKAWREIAIIQWTFHKNRKHLWDKKRNYSKVNWNKGKYEVLFNTENKKGIVKINNSRVENSKKKEKLIQKAWEIWVNDKFWLNPISDIFSENIERRFVILKDKTEALLITYLSGGATPGDSYLWVLDEGGLPLYWKMWVSIIPIGGMKATWENWIELENGAKISSLHRMNFFNLEIKDVKTAKSIEEIFKEDPFKDLSVKTTKF